MCAGKGNEVTLGENSASKEASAGPQLGAAKPLAVAIALTGAPARRRGGQLRGVPLPRGAALICVLGTGVKGSQCRQDESTVQPKGKRASEHIAGQQVRGTPKHRLASKERRAAGLQLTSEERFPRRHVGNLTTP